MRRNPYFPSPAHYPNEDEMTLFGRRIRQTVIANTGYEQASAEVELGDGVAQFVSFGTLFLANPDLPVRFKNGAGLNQPDRATMFGGGEQGYIDYPFLDASQLSDVGSAGGS